METSTSKNTRPHASKDKPYLLITGAAGALAQAVIELLKPNYQILAVDFRHKVRQTDGVLTRKVDFSKRAFEDLFRQYEIQGVIHLGRMGMHEVSASHRHQANVIGTKKLLDLCVKYEVKRVIVLSTYFVYGASAYNPSLLTEDHPLKASQLTMDLVDSVELENLASIYLWKHPQCHITILRPCNICGPGVSNSLSTLMSRGRATALMGFSPMMQFIHVLDMAKAIVVAFDKNIPGIYNVAPNDWIALQDAFKECGCDIAHILSIPAWASVRIVQFMRDRAFPTYLLNYFKYPVIINGDLFNKTFGFEPQYSLDNIFEYYREKKLSDGMLDVNGKN